MTWGANGETARCCPACSFVSWPKQPWDESPHPDFCPHDGLPLSQVRCRECSAPLKVLGGDSMMWGGRVFARCCTSCGADNAPPREPQRRARPKKEDEAKAQNGHQTARSLLMNIMERIGGVYTPGSIVATPTTTAALSPAKPRGSFLLMAGRARARMLEVRKERRKATP